MAESPRPLLLPQNRVRFIGNNLLMRLGFIASCCSLTIACGSRPAHALGFSGEFGKTNWATNCDLDSDFDCGIVVTDTNFARVNVSETSTNDFTSLWTNSSGRSTAYKLSFTISFTDNSLDPTLGQSYGYFQVGNGSPQGQVQSGETLTLSNIILTAGNTFSFGVYSDNPFMSSGNDAYLSIDSFNATATTITAPLVPAPLPAIGAASLFLGSRRLKKRIHQQRVLRLARRKLAPPLRSILPG